MNIDQKSLHFITDLKTSSQLATKIALLLQAPQLIELVGDLGGGKTTFTKALGKSLGVTQTITSPTFNIHRSYKTKDGRLEHFDLYRLTDDEIVMNELKDCLACDDSVVVVEWAQHFSKALSNDRLILEFEYIAEKSRKIRIIGTGLKSEKIIEGLR